MTIYCREKYFGFITRERKLSVWDVETLDSVRLASAPGKFNGQKIFVSSDDEVIIRRYQNNEVVRFDRYSKSEINKARIKNIPNLNKGFFKN